MPVLRKLEIVRLGADGKGCRQAKSPGVRAKGNAGRGTRERPGRKSRKKKKKKKMMKESG